MRASQKSPGVEICQQLSLEAHGQQGAVWYLLSSTAKNVVGAGPLVNVPGREQAEDSLTRADLQVVA